MEINVKLMTDEAYVTLQKNTEETYKQIQNHPSDGSWLKDFLGFEPYETKTYTIEDFKLLYSENYSDVALENTKILYEHLRCLPRYILCDIRFWAWIVFEKAYKQALSSSGISESLLKNTWLPRTSRRNLMLGVISRYYFMADVSASEGTNGLDYSLTEYAINNLEIFRLISYANFCMVKNVTLALLRAMRDYSNSNRQLNRIETRSIFKQITKLSSVHLVDMMSEDEIYDYCYKKIEKASGTDDIVIDFNI